MHSRFHILVLFVSSLLLFSINTIVDASPNSSTTELVTLVVKNDTTRKAGIQFILNERVELKMVKPFNTTDPISCAKGTRVGIVCTLDGYSYSDSIVMDETKTVLISNIIASNY